MENNVIPEDQPNKPRSNKIKPKPRPKPLLEGINAPRNTNDIVFVKPTLTSQENKLIKEIDQPKEEANEPKLLPKSVINRINQPPRSSASGWLLSLIVVLILAGGGYLIYSLYTNPAETSTQTDQSSGLSQEETALPRGNEVITDVSSSTPVMGTSTVASTTPPVKELKLKISSTPTTFLNVRNGPSLSNKVIAKVHPGEIYVYTELKSGWYNIILADKTTGWVFGEYVTVQ